MQILVLVAVIVQIVAASRHGHANHGKLITRGRHEVKYDILKRSGNEVVDWKLKLKSQAKDKIHKQSQTKAAGPHIDIEPIKATNKIDAYSKYAQEQHSFRENLAVPTQGLDVANLNNEIKSAWGSLQSMWSSLESQYGPLTSRASQTSSTPNPKWNTATQTYASPSAGPTSSSGSGSGSGSSGGGSNSSDPLKDIWKDIFPSDAMSRNNVFIGFLPDDGSGGGTSQTMKEINKAMNGKSATYGWYAQVQSGKEFDASQLWQVIDDVKESGAIFQPAVMPTGGWDGLTYDDDSQAVAIAKQMKKFNDEGIEVWLRFAHEMNYYQEDGTYQGDADDFKEGWAVVARACRKYAPKTKLWFTPNVGSDSDYDKYYPDDPSTVDLIGIDYYPKSIDESFVDRMKSFHDKYTSNTTKFAIGETGLGFSADISERLKWLQKSVSEESINALPNLISTSWFNYWKGYDFRIAGVDGDNAVATFIAGK